MQVKPQIIEIIDKEAEEDEYATGEGDDRLPQKRIIRGAKSVKLLKDPAK